MWPSWRRASNAGTARAMAEHANPSGCRHCGIDKHGHLSQWAPHPVGWHTWAEPTMEQRKSAIKANLGRFTGQRFDGAEQETDPKSGPAGFCCGCCDDEPEPDWADLHEMARNAGMEPELFVPGEVHWGRRVLRGILEPEHGWVVVRSRNGRRVIDLTGPDRRPARTCSLVDPTPAEVLAAARLVGLGGAS